VRISEKTVYRTKAEPTRRERDANGLAIIMILNKLFGFFVFANKAVKWSAQQNIKIIIKIYLDSYERTQLRNALKVRLGM
jgi:hypothetical protein